MIAKQTTSTEELIISHLPLAKSIAFKFKNCFPSFYDHEDVVGVAVKSLVSCVDSFDESKGKSFGAYSSIRINGSLIDEIRKNDQLSRSSRADFNLLHSTTLKMEKQLKRKPTDKEIKNKLNLNNSDYKKIIKNFVEGKESANSYSRDVPDTFKEKEQLYIVSNTGSLTKLPKGKTKREKLLVSKDNKMSGYIQTNNLNLRREKDFNQALDYFNAL